MDELCKNVVNIMIKETFLGPPDEGGMFTEPRSNSGLLGTLDQLTAREASIVVNGTTVGAHADHAHYYLWGSNAILREGKQPEMDWGKSWKINVVDEEQWKRIRDKLQYEYNSLLKAMDTTEWNEMLMKEVLGSLAHSAYHLGAIRQMVKAITIKS